jgi:hypothetical protein
MSSYNSGDLKKAKYVELSQFNKLTSNEPNKVNRVEYNQMSFVEPNELKNRKPIEQNRKNY